MPIAKPQFVVSQPSGFAVKWKINPHMKVGSTDPVQATDQHQRFVRTLEVCGAEAMEVPPVRDAYDSVFMKDNAVLIQTPAGRRALLAKPSLPERAREPLERAKELRKIGFEIAGQSSYSLEGGDVYVAPNGKFAFMGYGFRTSLYAKDELAKFLGAPVVPLELVDPYFYHLDTALNATWVDGRCVVFAYPGAFSAESWRTLVEFPEVSEVVSVDRESAMRLALNWVEIKGNIILGGEFPKVRILLESLGKTVLSRDLEQFRRAGGSAACLVAKVHTLPARRIVS